MSKPSKPPRMKFPKQFFATISKHDVFTVHDNMIQAVSFGLGRVRVATYKLEKIVEATNSVEILAEIGE